MSHSCVSCCLRGCSACSSLTSSKCVCRPRLLPVWARMSSGASGLDRQDPRTVEMSAAIGSRTVKERVEGGILPSGQPGQAGVGGDPADARSLPMLHAAAGGAAGDAKSWLHLSRSPNPSVWVKSDAQRALLTRMQGGGSATSVTGRDIQAVTDGSLGGVLGGTEVYTYPQLTGYAGHYDAVVVGAGIVGVSTAYHLLSRGLSVCLVEGRDCGGGTTGFSTAKVSSNHQIAYTILSSKHGKEAAKQYGQLSELGIQGLQAVVDAVPGLKEASEWERTPHVSRSGIIGVHVHRGPHRTLPTTHACVHTECRLPTQSRKHWPRGCRRRLVLLLSLACLLRTVLVVVKAQGAAVVMACP